MSDGERYVITVRETARVDVIRDKGIAVTFLSPDDTQYLVQLTLDEASSLNEMVAIALSKVKP